MNKKRIAGALLRLITMSLLILLLVYMGGCFDEPGIEPGRAAPVADTWAPSQQGVVRRVDETLWFEAVGTVRSRRTSTVAPLVPGQLIEMLAEAGQRVEKGAALARLDGRELSARLEQARGTRRAAEASAIQARAQHKRVAGLHSQQAATPEQLEGADASLARAEALLTAAEQRVLESEVSAGYALISSPMKGVITERLAEPGDVVWPGKPLYAIHDPGSLRLEASVREGLIARVQPTSVLQVELTSLDVVVEATIDEIIPEADPESRSFLVKASLPPVSGLYTGMFGRLRVPSGLRSVLIAPSAAIANIGQLHLCKVRGESGWQKRYVTVGARMGADIVVLSGLSEGEELGWDE